MFPRLFLKSYFYPHTKTTLPWERTSPSFHLNNHTQEFNPQVNIYFVQHIKQYHMNVLLNSYHLNGHTLGFHPQTYNLKIAQLTITSSSSSPGPPLTRDHCEDVLEPASDATDDIPERHSSSSSSGARSSDGN